MRRIVRVIGLGLLCAVLVAAPVIAGKPQMEKVPVNALFVDEFLTEACGVEVTTQVTGHFIFRLFTNAAGDPVREVNNYALNVRFSSVNGTIRAQDVGADRITYLDDGTLIQVIIGNVQSISIPGQGRVYADVGRTMVVITVDENGDPSFDVTPLGGQHDEDQLSVICGFLDG